MGFGNFLLMPSTEAINYATATRLLGINGLYGFQLTIMPIVTISITETKPANPLTFNIDVAGKGFPLANANVIYCFIKVIQKGQGKYPYYAADYGSGYTDARGSLTLSFQGISATDSYALIVHASLSGLMGVGYRERVTSDKRYVLPLIDSMEDRRILLAHSYDVHYYGPPESAVFYNATFVLLTEDFTLREMPMDNSTGKIGKVNYGQGQPYGTLTIPTYNPGILIITYESNNEYGVILMPWGMSSMAFPVVFGDNPFSREWVATDIRQVIVNDIAYQATLALWSYEGYQVIG